MRKTAVSLCPPRIAIGVLACLLVPSLVQAETLDGVTNNLASEIRKFLIAKNSDSIIVGNFEGPLDSKTGLRISQLLKEKLQEADADEKKRIRIVKSGAPFEVVGEFSEDDDKEVKRKRVVLEARIKNRRGQTDHVIRRSDELTVDNPADILTLVPTTADFTKPAENARLVEGVEIKPPAGEISGPQKHKLIATAIEKPTFALHETVVRPTESSPFGVEILVRKDGELVPARIAKTERGAFADLTGAKNFIIHTYNDTGIDLGVKIFVDGLSIFEFSQRPDFKVLGMYSQDRQRKTMDTIGWYINQQTTDLFELTDLPSAAAAQLGRPAGIGIISVQFFKAWREGEDEPLPPPQVRGAKGSPDQPAIGRGETVPQKKRIVKRFFGTSPLATVTIRYHKPEDDLPPGL